MEIKKRDILKAGVELAVGVGVGIIATNAINMVTPDHLSKMKRISVKIGSFALVWMVSSAASTHVNRTIDHFADGLQSGIKMAEKKAKSLNIPKDPDGPVTVDLQLDIPEEGIDDGRQEEGV